MGWSVLQPISKLLLATLDRFLIHAGDLREQGYAAMTQPVGFHGHIPAALLLIKAAQEQVHLPVQLPLGMIRRLRTLWTFASMDF
jgi:hypothetical protein